MDGDRIVVKLNYVIIASFVYRDGQDVFYISPTRMSKLWSWLNFSVLPYLSLVLFVINAMIVSDAYGLLCIGMLVLTVLSLISLQSCVSNPRLRNKMFKLDVL